MTSINETTISGTLSRDATFHPFDTGSRVANAEIRVPRGKTSDYPPLKGWGNVADALNSHGKKDNFVIAKGALRTELYPDPQDSTKKRKLKSTYVLVRELKILDPRTGGTLIEAIEEKRDGSEHESAEDAEQPVAV